MTGSLLRLPPFARQDGVAVLHVVVESPSGATAKIKLEPSVGAFLLSRPLPLGLAYPFHWGFVPGTRAEDGDPVDALVLPDATAYPGLVIPARPLAVVRLEQRRKQGDGRERNDRLVCVGEKSPRLPYGALADLPKRLREEIERFFVDAVYFEDKDVRLLGWGGADEGLALVRRSARQGRGNGVQAESRRRAGARGSADRARADRRRARSAA